MPADRSAPPAVIFDIDGTLLDSAAGIIAGFAYALRAVGIEPPSEDTLRGDLGPPIETMLRTLGVPERDVGTGVHAYRSFYRTGGLQQAAPYPGVVDLLDELERRGVLLGTATAKRTETAQAILEHHGLSHYFLVVNGTDDVRTSKTDTLAYTMELMRRSEPSSMVMVGDRHYDIVGAHACGVVGVGVTWGYGTADELRRAGADHVIDQPVELLALLPMRDGAEPPPAR